MNRSLLPSLPTPRHKRPIVNLLADAASHLQRGGLDSGALVGQLRDVADRLQSLAVEVLSASQRLDRAETVHQRAKVAEEVAEEVTVVLAGVLANLNG